MTELDMLRQVAAAADRLLRRADEDAARGRLNLAELWPAEVTALSEAVHAARRARPGPSRGGARSVATTC